MQLSESFTLEEMTVSQEAARRGISNEPDIHQFGNLRALCAYVLQPLRDHLRKPIIVTSGFRSAAVNHAVGGAPGSEHQIGLAADITVNGMTPKQVCETIVELGLPCRQVIVEFSRWAHVSLSLDPAKKPELLTAIHIDGKTVYRKGLA